MYYVYVLLSLNQHRIYVGLTGDLRRRYREHLKGKVYTTKRMLPVKLIFYEAFLDKRDAIKRENYLKSTKGKKTLKLMLKNFLNSLNSE